MRAIKIEYHDKTVKRLCTDLKKAKRDLPADVAEKLHALDIAGRKKGYRLVIIPLDVNGNKYEEKEVNIVYKSAEIIIAWEVSNHYE